MFGCCSLPTESVRWLVLLGLLCLELFFVVRKNRQAGLVMLGGTGLDLFTAVLAPLLEIAGITWFTGRGSGDPTGYMVAAWILIPMLGRLTIAIHLILLGIGIAMLARDLPDEERDWA